MMAILNGVISNQDVSIEVPLWNTPNKSSSVGAADDKILNPEYIGLYLKGQTRCNVTRPDI